MKRISAILAIIIATCHMLCANDSIHREVTITRDFTPIVRDAEKINSLPPISTPTFERRAVNYCYNATAAQVPTIANNVNIPYSPLFENYAKQHRGYIDLNMGNYLSIAANAGYRLVDTKKDQLNLGLQFTSFNWDIPVNSHASSTIEEKTRQNFYDTRLGLHYAHIFDNNITLAINGSYRYLDFNYYGMSGDPIATLPSHPFQKAHNFMAEIKIDNSDAYQYDYEHWHITGGYTLYRNNNGTYLPDASGEHHAYLNGSYRYMLDDYWSVGGDAEIDYLLYNGLIPAGSDIDNLLTSGSSISTRSEYLFMARIVPHAKWTRDRMQFRAGINIDISAGDGTIFRFAPDIHFNWEFIEDYFLYAAIDGGKQLHPWNDIAQYCIYFDPSQRIPSSYTPFDGSLGLQLHFIPELSLSLYGGYEVTTNALFQSIGYASRALSWQTIDANCLKAGLAIDANLCRYLTLTLDATYRLWKNNGIAITYDRPRWEGNARATIHPHSLIDIELGYNMQLDRNFGTYGQLADIHNLQASIIYSPLHWLSIKAHGNNLLNRRHDYYFGLPAPGIQAMIGIGIKL